MDIKSEEEAWRRGFSLCQVIVYWLSETNTIECLTFNYEFERRAEIHLAGCLFPLLQQMSIKCLQDLDEQLKVEIRHVRSEETQKILKKQIIYYIWEKDYTDYIKEKGHNANISLMEYLDIFTDDTLKKCIDNLNLILNKNLSKVTE